MSTDTCTVSYATRRRPAGLTTLYRFECSCGRTGIWTDVDTSREQGKRHGGGKG